MPVTHVPVTVSDAATYTVDPQNSGLRHYMPDLSQNCTITPPTPKAGLCFEFVYAGAAADASNWVIDTGTNTNYFVGGVSYVDDNPTADAIHSDGNSNSKMTVKVPEAGTWVRIECTDDTTWHVCGWVAAAQAPTFADQ